MLNQVSLKYPLLAFRPWGLSPPSVLTTSSYLKSPLRENLSLSLSTPSQVVEVMEMCLHLPDLSPLSLPSPLFPGGRSAPPLSLLSSSSPSFLNPVSECRLHRATVCLSLWLYPPPSPPCLHGVSLSPSVEPLSSNSPSSLSCRFTKSTPRTQMFF